MESVILKLQKLLNHERSARTIGNVHEAEAFAAKIAELLFAHKLSMSEVEIEQEERSEPVSNERVDGLRAPWAGTLVMGVCEASFCRALSSSKGYIFIGRTTDRSTAISMYRYLAAMGKSIADAEAITYKRSEAYLFESAFKPGIMRTWMASFLKGYANAVYKRLAESRKSLTAQAQSTGTSLVYIDKSKAAIDAYVRDTYGKVGKGRASTSSLHSGAYGAGQQAGQRVSIKSQGALN